MLFCFRGGKNRNTYVLLQLFAGSSVVNTASVVWCPTAEKHGFVLLLFRFWFFSELLIFKFYVNKTLKMCYCSNSCTKTEGVSQKQPHCFSQHVSATDFWSNEQPGKQTCQLVDLPTSDRCISTTTGWTDMKFGLDLVFTPFYHPSWSWVDSSYIS